MEKRLILNSHGGNYSDYYDHWFDAVHSSPPGTPVWIRNSRVFPLRRESFETLERFGIPTPAWGTVKDLKLSKLGKVVVYTDETYHQGMGKELISVFEAWEKYPDLLASEYVDNPFYRFDPLSMDKAYISVSRRYLMVGNSAWVMEYRSENDWRSNVGEVDIEFIGELKDEDLRDKMLSMMKHYKSPIFALDVVPQSKDVWLCTDLNLAPGMHNCGIRDFVNARQACELIKDFYFEHCT